MNYVFFFRKQLKSSAEAAVILQQVDFNWLTPKAANIDCGEKSLSVRIWTSLPFDQQPLESWMFISSELLIILFINRFATCKEYQRLRRNWRQKRERYLLSIIWISILEHPKNCECCPLSLFLKEQLQHQIVENARETTQNLLQACNCKISIQKSMLKCFILGVGAIVFLHAFPLPDIQCYWYRLRHPHPDPVIWNNCKTTRDRESTNICPQVHERTLLFRHLKYEQ